MRTRCREDPWAVSLAPGAPAQVVDPRTAACSQVCFEFGADGMAYIRTEPGHDYLAVEPGDASPQANRPVRLDRKSSSRHLQRRRRWKLTLDRLDEAGKALFLISAQAYPHHFLQPGLAGIDNSQLVVVRDTSSDNARWRVEGPTTAI